MTDLTQADIDRLAVEHPNLSGWGYASPGLRHRNARFSWPGCDPQEDRLGLSGYPLRLDEVRTVAGWLSGAVTVKARGSGQLSSYALKHKFEYVGCEYVINGSFIAACLLLDIPVWLRDCDVTANPNIGLSVRWLRARLAELSAHPSSPPRAG